MVYVDPCDTTIWHLESCNNSGFLPHHHEVMAAVTLYENLESPRTKSIGHVGESEHGVTFSLLSLSHLLLVQSVSC